MRLVIAGSRRMSGYGKKVIEKLVPELIAKGVEIGTGRVQGCNDWVKRVGGSNIRVFKPDEGFEKMNEELAKWGEGLLAIEGGKESGTILLAEKFLEKGKDVWAVPGGIFEENSKATNFLIKNGAGLAESVDDIIGTNGI